MKKTVFLALVSFLFLYETASAQSFRWDLINALIRNDFSSVDSIMKTNINTMSPADKRHAMNLAINYASGENTLRVCQMMLGYGIFPDTFDLFTAINRNRQNETINFLLINGAVPNGEILLLTMSRERHDLARYFIESGIDVNYQYPLSLPYADGMTPLLYAVKQDNYDLVRLLVDKGADVNSRTINGDTPLTLARAGGYTEILSFLQENGANEIQPTVPAGAGITSLSDSGGQGNFQKGTYMLFGGGLTEVQFFGDGNVGSLRYTNNGRIYSGLYRIENSVITLIIDNQNFVYRVDSDISFSGNGELWIRTGD